MRSTTTYESLNQYLHYNSSPTNKNLTLSNNWWTEFSLFLNNLLLHLVHKTQTQQSQRSFIKERRARKPHEEWTNWTKWSCKWSGSADATPIHNLTRLQREAREGHDINTWWAVSDAPQPVTHNCKSWEIMSWVTKWSFDSTLFRKSLHAKIETFRETCSCQIKSEVASKPCILTS